MARANGYTHAGCPARRRGTGTSGLIKPQVGGRRYDSKTPRCLAHYVACTVHQRHTQTALRNPDDFKSPKDQAKEREESCTPLISFLIKPTRQGAKGSCWLGGF